MKVLVIGDVIVDRYIRGKKKGVSAETPTVVATLEKEETFVGGAGLVVRHLLRLGNEVTLVTANGLGDSELEDLFLKQSDCISEEELLRLKVKAVALPNFSLTEKRRYYVDSYKMVQYDLPNRGKYLTPGLKKMLDVFCDTLEQWKPDAVVVADNRHGVMNDALASIVVDACQGAKVPLYVDSQVSQHESNHDWYTDADYIFLNEVEMDHVVGKALDAGFVQSTKGNLDLCSQFLNANVVYKRGERGAVYVPRNGPLVSDLGFKVDAVDTCGAGDAFLAAFVTLGNLADANRWAALSTMFVGTIVPQVQDLGMVAR